MLRARHGLEAVDDLERLGVDHVDPAGDEIGRIDARRHAGDRGAEHARGGAGVDVARIDRRGRSESDGRQIDRLLRTELIGGKRDEVARRSALLAAAPAHVGASGARGARGRNGERLRGAQPESGAERDRGGRRGG